MAREQRRYSDADKATALATLDANGGNVYATAREIGIPRKTLEQWSKDRGVVPDVARLRQVKRGDLAAALEDLAWALVAGMGGKVEDANLQHAAVSLAITIDKMRLLREQPTAINRDDSLSDEERGSRVLALLDRARARRAGLAPEESAIN